MIPVTQAYRDAMDAPIRGQGYAWITWQQLNDDAQQAAYVSGYSEQASYSDAESLLTPWKNTSDFTAFTAHGFSAIPSTSTLRKTGSTYTPRGFISTQISVPVEGESYGVFDENPYVDISFTTPQTLGALTLTFSGVWSALYPAEMVVSLLRGGVVVNTKTFTDELDQKCVLEIGGVDIDAVHLEFTKTLVPGETVRLNYVQFGAVYQYDNSDIVSVTIDERVSPLGTELPEYKTQIKLKNINGRFDPADVNSPVNYMEDGQQITVEFGALLSDGTVSRFQKGVYYLKTWDVRGIEATFSAVSIVPRLTETLMERNAYYNGFTMDRIFLNVASDAGLTTSQYDSTVPKNNYNPWPSDFPITSHANCLQMIANATQCILRLDHQNKLRLVYVGNYSEWPTTAVDFSLPVNRVYHPVYNKRLEKLSVVNEKVLLVSDATPGLSETLASLRVSTDAEYRIELPRHGTALTASIDIAGATATITYHSTRVCYVAVTGVTGQEATLTMTGRHRDETETTVTHSARDKGGVLDIQNNMYSLSRAMDHAAWVSDYYDCDVETTISTRGYPELECGDVIAALDSGYALLVQRQLVFNGAFSDTLTVRRRAYALANP